MRFFAVLAVIAAIVGIVFLTFYEKVEAGHVGIKVDLLGSNKGVETQQVSPGRHFIGFNEELHIFPTYKINGRWEDPCRQERIQNATCDEKGKNTGMSMQSIKGLNIGADIGYTISFIPEMVPTLFQDYRKGPSDFTDVDLRNAVVDALNSEASTMAVDMIYGEDKASLMERVEDRVRQKFSYAVNIEDLYWIGALELPSTIRSAIDAEIAENSKARQRANQIAGAQADAQKARERAQGEADAILLKAAAQAEANALIADSLTPAVLTSLSLDRWNGILPSVTGETVPMISFDASLLQETEINLGDIRERSAAIRERISPPEETIN